MRRIALLLPFALVACADNPAPTEPAHDPAFAVTRLDDYNAREPMNMSLFYSCSAPNEMVHLSGTVHTVSKRFVDGAGTEHWSFHSHPIQMRGTGEISGREFRVVGAENTNRVVHEDGYRRFLQTAILRLMGPGNTPAWTVRINIWRHRTPPAPFEYRIDRVEVECK